MFVSERAFVKHSWSLSHSSFSSVVSVEDLERNDGSAERPYLMPESLRKTLNKKNKTPPAE